MKIIVEPSNKDISKYVNICDGILLGIDKFSVINEVKFSLDEIKNIVSLYKNLDIFIKMDKNIFNDDIKELTECLIFLDKLNIKGIFFYDLAILNLKKKLDLKVDLVWNQTHMVTNYKTCDYYYDKGVKYALMSKEITLDEILEIANMSKISQIVEVVSLPSVGFSRRSLITNYNHDIGQENSSSLVVTEKVTGSKYRVIEEDNGTAFLLNEVVNGISVIKSLYDNNCSYILFRQRGIDDFYTLVSDTNKYILGGCRDINYLEKYKKLGNNTGFFFKKTIYKVK